MMKYVRRLLPMVALVTSAGLTASVSGCARVRPARRPVPAINPPRAMDSAVYIHPAGMFSRIQDVLNGVELATLEMANQLSAGGSHREAAILYDRLFDRTRDIVTKAALADLAFVSHFRAGDGRRARAKACFIRSQDPALQLALQASYYQQALLARVSCR